MRQARELNPWPLFLTTTVVNIMPSLPQTFWLNKCCTFPFNVLLSYFFRKNENALVAQIYDRQWQLTLWTMGELEPQLSLSVLSSVNCCSAYHKEPSELVLCLCLGLGSEKAVLFYATLHGRGYNSCIERRLSEFVESFLLKATAIT